MKFWCVWITFTAAVVLLAGCPESEYGADTDGDGRYDSNDCDSLIDENTESADDDLDGYCEGVDLGQGVQCCDGSLPGDCDDTDAAIYPGAGC